MRPRSRQDAGGTAVADFWIAPARPQQSHVRDALRKDARLILRDRLEGLLWFCTVATALTVAFDLLKGTSPFAPGVLIKSGGTLAYLGGAIATVAFLTAIYFVADTLLRGPDVPGYASLIVSVMFFSGVQLMSLGIIGEYIGRIFAEVKRRPLYVVAERIGPAAAGHDRLVRDDRRGDRRGGPRAHYSGAA